jgi:hypothetical protein
MTQINRRPPLVSLLVFLAAVVLSPHPAHAQSPCKKDAHIRITPSGWTDVSPTTSTTGVGDVSFCLDSGPETAATWNRPRILITAQDGTEIEDKEVKPGETYPTVVSDRRNTGLVNIEIRDENSSATNVLAQRLLKAANDDETFTASMAQIEKAYPEVGIEKLKKVAAQVAKIMMDTQSLVYAGVMPVRGGSRQQIIMGAWDGPSTARLDLGDGDGVEVFAFNITQDQPQDVEVVQGSAVPPSSLAGALLKVFKTVTSGGLSPLGISPESAERPEGKVASALLTFRDKCSKDQKCHDSLYRPTASYTSRRTVATVVGGYNYAAQVCKDPPPKGGTDSGKLGQQPASSISKACTGAASDQITASVAFTTRAVHRIWGVGVELGWDMWEPKSFAMSGYGFQPVAQGGPDQLYQLQGQSKPVDRAVFSALMLLYPFEGRCLDYALPFLHIPLCANHFAIGFGPTFWRGAGAEAFRQWNLRAGYEITSGVLVSFGPSWRSFDAPVQPIGTIESVPKPAQAPPLQTSPQWAMMWTAGLTVDLSLIGDAVTAVSAAASSGSAKGKP